MQTELQVSLDSESHLHPENILVHDTDPDVTPSAANHVTTNYPAKRPTRQWAAWTRQEEESFFTALRQVGKNFEKITHRVQSKNKDQVRHYYYRLVRRMNKLLGPGLCLDAKDSKDTNAAMLRWWSLLEKYSCKASKLRLKPRRFKIFIEALEHQLLKDRRKNVKKRPSLGENCPLAAPNTVPNQSRASGQDACMVKLVLVDGQNIQKLGSGKTSLKRNINVGVSRTNNKGETTTMKPGRQRRKPAAYKKWEKAAIAGVSLVADAAEHLERTATDKEVENDPGIPCQKGSNPVSKVLPPFPTYSHNLFVENNVLTSMKLKLQLFPIDDGTRRALEMDKHNPHLELTLSSRKKISSVLEHLNRKWGNSSVASGELLLFPYSVQGENLMDCPRWTQDSIVSAADVYAMLGRPPVFRLRYGWFSDTELGSAVLQQPSASGCNLAENIINNDNIEVTDSPPISVPSTIDRTLDLHEDQPALTNQNHALPPSSNYLPCELDKWTGMASSNKPVESSDLAANISWCRKEAGDGTIMRQFEDVDDLKFGTGPALTAGDWADTLTNISIGDLLSGVSHDIDVNCIDPPVAESSECLQQVPFSCDSFDAAIAAHISKHQDKTYQPTLSSHASSIWDAEETCDAFSYKKNSVFCQLDPILSRVTSTGSCKQTARTSLEGTDCLLEESPEVEEPVESPAEDAIDETQSCTHILDTSTKDFSTLADIYWPDSLGPLDLDKPSSKYHSEDLILSDSLGGLNRLIASSLDAFQNCSFFGLDKKNQH
ncbi:TSL-kinase interacting protein 1-like isoform X3 [Carya illinoinensis]|uniref:TSL-kinase interacting protein 1-like isoform X3 n=1 Tax=Carya illinoinensis TaxID=32201 RepID=UPI001C726EE0|nr:TSL-kinase interacting protein 1-like isoform X3 [Carya illinoinensis]